MKLVIELDYGSHLILDHTLEVAAAVNLLFGGGTWRQSWKVRETYAPAPTDSRMRLVRSVRVVSTEEMERLEQEYDAQQELEKASA